MKLTKSEIQYIDKYLIKNEVKFWDVRIELLDHIVSAVEDKIHNEGISFNEALLDVHRGFGNQLIKQRTQNQSLSKGLYQSNIGFKKFIKNEQKKVGRKHRRKYWIVLKKLLMSYTFIIEYALLVLLVFIIYQYQPKTAFIISLCAIALPHFYKFRYVFKKSVITSLAANMVDSFSISFLCFQGLILNFYKETFTYQGQLDYSYIIGFYLFLYPFFRAGIANYIKVIDKVRQRYNLLNS